MDRVKIREAGRLAALLFAAALVLDSNPANAAVEISTKPTANMTCSSGVCTPTAKKAVLNVTDLATMLASDDVTIRSDASSKDIEIDAALSWTSTQRLTLDAYQSIAFNKPVVVAGTGAMTITTNDSGTGGDFHFLSKASIDFWDSASDLVINGNRYNLAASIKKIKSFVRGGARYIAITKKFNAENFSNLPMRSGPDILEGLGHTISNLNIFDPDNADNVGLFTIVTARDLALTNVTVLGTGADQRVGAIAGEGSAINCSVTGQVSATGPNSRVGALLGLNTGIVRHSSSSATITGGWHAKGAGGLIGQNDGLIEESAATGAVSGDENVLTGGIVGYNFGGSVTNSYATGAVSGGASAQVGGLIGGNTDNSDTQGTPLAATSYSTGALSGGSGALVGGLIGSDVVDATNANLYWDLDTSSISNPSKGAGNIANDPGITGLSDTQLKSGLPSGFDKNVWKQNAAINNGYPYLIGNPPAE